jgi:ATP-dependent Zn protease
MGGHDECEQTLNQLLNEAELLAVLRNRNEVGMEEFEEAVERID